MPKFLKLTLYTLAGLSGLAVLGLLAILILVDPNDFKDDITQAVRDATGRELALQGNIELSVFPWLGLSLGHAELGNAPDFGTKPMASVETVDIRVKLLPLLKKQLEMDTVQLHGLNLSLARKADGSTNWDDLAGDQTTETAPAETPSKPAGPPPLAALAIGGVELSDARVLWDDQQTGQRVELLKLNLHTGPLAPPQPVDVTLDVDNQLAQPAIKGHLDFSGRMGLDLAAQHYRVDDLLMTLKAAGKELPVSPIDLRLAAIVDVDLQSEQLSVSGLQLDALGSQLTGTVKLTHWQTGNAQLNLALNDPNALASLLPAALPAAALSKSSLTTDAQWDLEKQTATVKSLRIKGLGLQLQASLEASQIIDAPHARGQLQVAQFSPRQLARKLAIELPEMADLQTLQKASLALDFDGSMDGLTVPKLALTLDDTNLSGKASVRNFAQPAIRYQLAVDGVDVDRYLPPASDTPPPTPATAAVGAVQLPLELLRALDVDGRLTLGKLKAANARLNDIELVLKAKDGRLRLHPAQAKLYGGSYAGDIGLDVQSNTPKLALNEILQGVQAGPLLKDLLGDDKVLGTANAQAKLSAQGTTLGDIIKTLNGQAQLSFLNGAVKGVNIGQMLREAYAKVKSLPPPPKAEEQTDFAEITASVKVNNGVVDNRDLSAKSPALRINGAGTVDLPAQRLNYKLTTTLVESLKGQGGEEASELKGIPFPIKVTGSFQDPKFSLDLKPLLEARAKQELERQKQKLKKKADEAIEQEREKAKEKVKNEVNKALKGLFR